ncbi:MAG: inorganic diphosphatase [Betaproteobacteria bacterium]|nr:inorganic diphosphatase [Betaproteobacteria bacterium]
MAPFLELRPRDEQSGLVNVVIDTPRGSRNKYKVDEKLGVLKLSRILPEGHAFPFDFGSIPRTRADDGDALDVMVLLEEPTFPGCVLQVRLIGVLTGTQTEKRKTIRNDRLLAVPETNVNKPAVRKMSDLDAEQLKEIDHFFVSYNAMQGRRFKPGRPQGPKEAERRLRAAMKRFSQPAR